ncbi:hypothetical protein LR48_Vigan02g089500 [Vigna angularis]|uniref:Uncharacterized protein n=1 Tax=Phaseolus angularis TaxID=3914 RepID=A0A0L9TW18_PHAAN|nr:hypothetical protein LR48_Vigan02g089500 [Vigna angularis]
MASSSGKRIKTIESKRKDKEPKCSYANKFLSRKHECHFKRSKPGSRAGAAEASAMDDEDAFEDVEDDEEEEDSDDSMG